MSLTPLQRTRYARHVLLPELAEAGQERLLSARVCFASGDAGALEVARTYLARAGVQETQQGEGAALALSAPNEVRLAALFGSEAFSEAARVLCGALCAVEAIKSLTQLGEPGDLAAILDAASEEV